MHKRSLILICSFILLAVFVACQTPKNYSNLLMEHVWKHSHEEDSGRFQVFRSASYHFPRSRGRIALEFIDNGTLKITRLGPSDRPAQHLGSWRIDKNNQLVLEYNINGKDYINRVNVEFLDSEQLRINPKIQ